MVNQNDLKELEKSIISQFTRHLATLGQERHADLQKLGSDVGDLKKLIEAKLSGLDQRVVALEDSISLTNAEIADKGGLVDRIKGLENKVVRLEKGSEETQGKDLESTASIYEELQLREAKKRNIIVFGLEETEGVPDRLAVTQLLNEIDASADFHLYRAGKSSPTDNKRPIVVKFLSIAQQEKVLHNASKLKGKENYKTVSLSPDFTKRQRELNKQHENTLKDEAAKRNADLSQEQKNDGVWVPGGRRGARRLVKRTN